MASSAFLQRPSLAQIFASLLVALCFALPFSSGPIPLILFFHSQLLLLTFVGCFYYFKHPLHFAQKQPVWHKVLLITALSLLLSWLLVLSANHSVFQKFMSSQRIAHDFLTLAVVFTLASLQVHGQFSLKRCIYALALGMFCMMLLQFYSYQQGVTGDIWFATPPLAPHIRDLGNLACVMIVSLSVFWLDKKAKPIWEQSFIITNLLANWAFLIWTGGRTGIVASLLCSAVLIILFRWQQKTAWWRIISVFLLIIAALQLGNQLSVFQWNGIGRTLSFSQQAAKLNPAEDNSQGVLQQANQITTGRAVMWKISIEAALEKPWFGLGPYGYFFIEKRDYDDQPHNFLVQFFVQWGLVGTLLLATLLLACAYQIIRFSPKACRQGNSTYLVGAAIVFVLTLHGLTGGTYFKIQPLFALALGFSTLLAFACQGHKSNL